MLNTTTPKRILKKRKTTHSSVSRHNFFGAPEHTDNSPTHLLQATLPNTFTVVEFAEDNVNGNCGFIALGTDREALSEKLLLLKEDEKSREFLAEEIMNAFFSYGATNGVEGLSPPIVSEEIWEKLQKNYEETQNKFYMLFYKICNHLSDKSAITQDKLDASITWLKNNNKYNEAEELMEYRSTMIKAHTNFIEYCKTPLVFNYYVNALRNASLRLGYKSALLYAKNINITLYIWKKNTANKGQLELIDCHIVNGNADEIHVLNTQGFTHFNLLSKPLPKTNQDKSIKSQNNIEQSRSMAYEAYLRKEEKLLEGINFENLSQLMEQCKKRIEPAKKKDLILLVGRTGAGKSTTLNYLMGSRLTPTKKGMQILLDVKEGDKVYAEIGHELMKSKTLFPQVVSTAEHQQLAYVDLPGLRDTRILDEKLCSSVAFPMVVHCAHSIRGIICVIDAKDLTTGRGEAFVDLLGILGGLFKNQTELNTNQLLFVFTKVPAENSLEDVLETIKNTKKELLEAQEKHNQELEEIIQTLAAKVNLLKEWTQANQNGNEEDKLRIQIKVMETASQAPFNAMPDIQNVNERCNVMAEKVQEAIVQLMGMELILKHAEHTNLFIIRGNEKDDKDKLLKNIAELRTITPIPKEEFVLHGNKAGEWNILDKVIQEIAVEGTELLNAKANYTEENSTLKKYKKLVEKQKNQQALLLQKLKSSTLPIEELEKIREEIITLSEELNNCLEENIEKKQLEKQCLEEELISLDTSEPIRHKHRSLEPVVFISEKNKAVFLAKMLVPMISMLWLIPEVWLTNITTGGIIAGGIIGGISGCISGDASLKSIGKGMAGMGVGMGMGAVSGIYLPLLISLMPGVFLLYNSHHFRYDDLPFINIERKSNPDFELSAFDISTQIINPAQGKYEIICRFLSPAPDQTCWIELFVEKRIHPDFRQRIQSIQRKLEWLEFTMSGYLKHDLEQLAKTANEAKFRLSDISNREELQSVLCKILEDRLSQYQKRHEILQGCFLGYQASVKERHQEILRQKSKYIMLKQVTEIIGQTNTFVKDFLSAYESYLMQEKTKPLTNVWGRKNSPDQQPDYQVEDDKPEGCSIGSVFKPQDKPYSAGWYGKLGYWCHLSPSETTAQLAPYSQARRATALEAVAEKIAADLYHYLSDGNYYVPKTRLAELPIENCFTKKHGSTRELLKKVNQGREDKIEEGVYVMSKRVENYKDLAELKNCVLGEELLNFQQCLERGKLPEEVIIENKKVPLKGVMEILAASRLLGDTDVLGGGGNNTGFLIERDANGQAIAVRAVKIDPGLAFNFRGEKNLFYQSLNFAAPSTNLFTQDKRHLQYGNMAAKPLLWTNLTETQQNQFIAALAAGLKLLSNTEEVAAKFIDREAFKFTPKQRQLSQAKECLKDLKANLAWQEQAYEKELAELKKIFSYRI